MVEEGDKITAKVEQDKFKAEVIEVGHTNKYQHMVKVLDVYDSKAVEKGDEIVVQEDDFV